MYCLKHGNDTLWGVGTHGWWEIRFPSDNPLVRLPLTRNTRDKKDLYRISFISDIYRIALGQLKTFNVEKIMMYLNIAESGWFFVWKYVMHKFYAAANTYSISISSRAFWFESLFTNCFSKLFSMQIKSHLYNPNYIHFIEMLAKLILFGSSE